MGRKYLTNEEFDRAYRAGVLSRANGTSPAEFLDAAKPGERVAFRKGWLDESDGKYQNGEDL